MNCTRARRAMLTAPLAELQEGGGGRLASHAASCGDCRSALQSVVRQTDSLRHSVDRMRKTEGNQFVSRPRPDAVGRHVVGGLAIAAGVVVIFALVGRRGPRPQPPDVIIENAQGRDVSVRQSADTTNVVFWSRDTK